VGVYNGLQWSEKVGGLFDSKGEGKVKGYYFASSKLGVLSCFRVLDKLYPKNKYYFVDRGAQFKPKDRRYRIYKEKQEVKND